ncbi:MAG: hypothetical protein U0800_06890 [Isosphaeraceae bacterium]
MDISIPDIWQRVGKRRWSQEAAAKLLASPPGDANAPYLLVLHWPSSASYLDISARRGKDEPFLGEADEVLRQLKAHGIPYDQVPAALARRRCKCLAAVVKADDKLTLDVEVDTNHPEFLEEAAEAGEDGINREVEVLAVPDAGLGGAARPSVGSLHLHLEPASPMRRYDGYVALDLGNTNTTLVGLHAHAVGHAGDVDVINVEGRAGCPPVPSALRLTQFEPAPEDEPDRMEEAECFVGESALSQASGWLVLGAKRILAEADPDTRHPIWLGGQRHSVSKTLPAELFLSELFRFFHREKLEVPRQLSITHPTTFSPYEIGQLRQAVVQGWRRSLGAESRIYDASKLVNPELPHLIIDEASAAAFYFLYRDFLDAPGGLDLLDYLYPEGLNLLVYDCGGGTTDIALVHARVHRGDLNKRKARRTSRLEIQVLGRTGHRAFGGDDITTAAFRVLKARLASRLAGQSKLPYPEMPAQAGELAAWLDDHRREINAAVPTEFTRDNLAQGEGRRRMEATKLLWQLAEQFKINLGRENPYKHKAGGGAMIELCKLLESLRGPSSGGPGGGGAGGGQRIDAALQGIEIHREEIDALIAEPLEQSIEYANRMIAAKLGRPDSPGGEVHRVYVVGNASRYPTVRRMIEEKLQVPFIHQRIAQVGESDLKNSVAKGAALALRLITAAANLEIDFDRRLNAKLPFDVTIWDPTAGGHRTLYHEHEDYDQLSEKPLPVPEADGFDDAPMQKDVFLARRWPGDDEPRPFLRFHFEEVIRGPLVIRYDTEDHRFRMRDEGASGEEVVGEELQKAVYIAPVQSGKL